MLLQGIFPTPESNPSLLRCRQILYRLNYEGRQFSKNKLISVSADVENLEFLYTVGGNVNVAALWKTVWSFF